MLRKAIINGSDQTNIKYIPEGVKEKEMCIKTFKIDLIFHLSLFYSDKVTDKFIKSLLFKNIYASSDQMSSPSMSQSVKHSDFYLKIT